MKGFFMFTGLIKEIGRVKSIQNNSTGRKLEIACPKLRSQISVDDSVATNGVCLTASELGEDSFSCQAIHVTLEKSGIGKLKTGDPVNLELALRMGDRLGGHMVSGHVNFQSKLLSSSRQGENYQLWFEIDPQHRRYFISEGSVGVDGVSLTIAALEDKRFCVSLIPHTWHHTCFQYLKVGESANIEVDMVAKYIENFAKFPKPSLTLKGLEEMGY
jgi:riboflavin synthase